MTSLRQSSWGLIVLVCLYTALSGASLGKVIPLISDIAASVRARPVQGSLLLSVVAGMAVLFAPVAGWAADRFGDRRLVMCGLLILSAGSAAGALAASYPALIVGRCTEGVGYIAVLTATAGMMMRTVQGSRQATAMSMFGASIPAGIGLGEGLAGLTAAGNWRQAFWGHSAVLILSVFALGLVPSWRRPPAHGHGGVGALEIYRHIDTLRLGIALGLLTLAQFGISSLLPTYLHVAFGTSVTRAALFGGGGLVASIVGSLGAGAVLESASSLRTLVISAFAVMGLTGALVYAASAGAGVCIAASIVFFVVGGFTTGLVLAILPRVLPNPAMRGRASGLVNQWSNVGILAAPPVAFAIFGSQGNVGVIALVVGAAIAAPLVIPVAAASRTAGVPGSGPAPVRLIP